jgi:hypothetical protein
VFRGLIVHAKYIVLEVRMERHLDVRLQIALHFAKMTFCYYPIEEPLSIYNKLRNQFHTRSLSDFIFDSYYGLAKIDPCITRSQVKSGLLPEDAADSANIGAYLTSSIEMGHPKRPTRSENYFTQCCKETFVVRVVQFALQYL